MKRFKENIHLIRDFLGYGFFVTLWIRSAISLSNGKSVENDSTVLITITTILLLLSLIDNSIEVKNGGTK